MIIQIHGAGFHNYGAWLMLETVISELSSRLSHLGPIEFCALPSPGTTYEIAATYNLKTVLPQTWRRNPIKYLTAPFFERLIPDELQRILGIVPRHKVDAMIDISGYAFGDHWGPDISRVCGRRFRFLHDRGKPVIMLPQMMGPFENEKVKRETLNFLPYIDRIYVRDRSSLLAINEILEDQAKVKLAPDITIFSSGEFVEARPPFACIIPNERMFDKGAKKWGSRYLQLLTQAGQRALALNRDIVLLSHAPGGGDLAIAHQLADRLDSPRVEVVTNVTPKRAKGIISNADLVVGSRFHALVAALSSGVPAIAIGWAHKYSHLLLDFGIPNLNFDPDQTSEELLDLIAECLNETHNATIRQTLQNFKKEMVLPNEQMWQDVASCFQHYLKENS
ncbi:polysaccharide pyruvyl transferase family protein [Candidatus Nitrospira neomarina]|uniref:Polysaccharide pyruvyl transferase family protein n=1 Tax=Candidatus Nitrospira neomarina TaxID=3020899 RepID=A0AA96K2F6_9BACT|nr:polysaccharide pyruvyl transferase family protein [Candidatus Nitrospira neomarina]WNM64081.1 polysaccharide pyruvyl transferase family protein [Candidatus Nitrospira neomarina]